MYPFLPLLYVGHALRLWLPGMWLTSLLECKGGGGLSSFKVTGREPRFCLDSRPRLFSLGDTQGFQRKLLPFYTSVASSFRKVIPCTDHLLEGPFALFKVCSPFQSPVSPRG